MNEADHMAQTIAVASLELTLAETGAFAIVFSKIVMGGPVEADRVANLLRTYSGRWPRLQHVLEPLFQVENGIWSHPLADEVRRRVERTSHRQSQNAKKRWNRRPMAPEN